MRRKLLSAFIALMLFAPSMSHAQSSGTTKLVSNKVEISKGQQYHMFFKEYSEKVREYLSNKKRIAIKNLTISKSKLNAKAGVAAVAGLMLNASVIENCHTTADVEIICDNFYAAGICGGALNGKRVNADASFTKGLYIVKMTVDGKTFATKVMR